MMLTMPESANERLFRTKVLPIMDKVMADLRHKQAEEMERHTKVNALPAVMKMRLDVFCGLVCMV